MRYLQVLARCYFNARFYQAEDGIVVCESDAEAKRVVAAGLAEDVTGDFADLTADLPAGGRSAPDPGPGTPEPGTPEPGSDAEITPTAAAAETKPAKAK